MDQTPSDEPKPARKGLFARSARPKAPPPAPKKKKRSRPSLLSHLSVVLSLVLVSSLVGVGAFSVVLLSERRAGPLKQDKVVLLTHDEEDGSLAAQLEKAGVIDNATLFSIMTLLDGQRGDLKRGEYDFHAGVSMRDVEDMLTHHRVLHHKISIPEGLTSEQVLERLRESDLLTGEIKEPPREGSLFPDTYVFERGDSRAALIAHMEASQSKAVADIWARHAPDLPVKSPGELVTLASIVEKETGKSDERPHVASVFVNRLLKHMRLQSDPTIVYGLVFGKGTLGHAITRTELQEATPYNTYMIDGLPPGPICNPGRAAMEAVANPSKSHDLYFVADGTGGHAFAETLDQHQKNVAHWRQIEKDAKDRLSPDASPPGNIRGEAFPLSDPLYGDLGKFAPAPAARALGAAATTGREPAPAPQGSGATILAKHDPAAAPQASGAASLARRDPAPASKDSGTTTVAKQASAPASQAFGALAFAGGDPSPAAAPLAAKLDKVAISKRKIAALLGAGGSLSPEKLNAAPLDRVVVTGVNDPPPGGDDASAPVSDGPVATAPMSASAYADMKARAARYSGAQSAGAQPADPPAPLVSAFAPTPAPLRPRAFDASEGTRLDPLRNSGYDLSTPKDIPAALR